jgi:pilus assembly protein CpaF
MNAAGTSPSFDPHGGLIREMKDRLMAGSLSPDPASVAAALTEERCLLGPEGIEALSHVICEEFLGSDPVIGHLRDPAVTDVLINGSSTMWVEREGKLERVENGFADEEAVRAYAQRLAIRAGRRVDDASPYVDARLPDGTRMHAILPPLAVEGTTISLRIPRRQAYTLGELNSIGTLADDAVGLLEELVDKRVAFLVSGGAGTGKTTLLSTLLSLADPGERLVLVEDCAELAPDHPHVVRLETRPPNQEGRGRVTIRELVRQALRMRPSRIILGEARGGEIIDLFTALNSGHEGGCGTLHANRPQDVPARIEALGLLAGVSREAVNSQAAAALRVVLHLVRDEDGRRRLESVAVLRRRAASGPLQAALALTFDQAGRTREWPGLDLLEAELGRGRYAGLPPERGAGRPSRPDYARMVADEYRDRVPWIPRPRTTGDGEQQ